MDYLALKWLHILSATILFGTGIGSAFCLFVANRRRDVAGIAFATRLVVLADWIFTAPAVVVQLATGLALTKVLGLSLTEGWITGAIVLFAAIGACWLPVVVLQIRMRDLAQAALTAGTDLPERYWRLDRWWIVLGSIAFPLMVTVFSLMVFKPAL